MAESSYNRSLVNFKHSTRSRNIVINNTVGNCTRKFASVERLSINKKIKKMRKNRERSTASLF